MIYAADHDSVLYVAQNMRAADRQEIYGLMFVENPHDIVYRVMAQPQFAFAAVADGAPAAIFGMAEHYPRNWSAFCFATDAFPKVALGVTRFLRRVVRPHLFGVLGAHRVGAFSHAEHVHAHKWLQLLGAKPEGIARGYGKTGDDYVLFGMTASDFAKIAGDKAPVPA